MDRSFDISTYLRDFNKINRRGACKACDKSVKWSRDDLAAHKRATCANASLEEKRRFAKRQTSSGNNSNASDHSSHLNDESADAECSNCNMNEGLRKDIDMKFANFFLRTGVSFRLADSEALKDLITALNPEYARSIPSSKTLAGSLLDKCYEKCSKEVTEILVESQNLTLISDGWTNIRGDHIINFCVKAPGQTPFFYSSIDTSGIHQNAAAVAAKICSVIEEIGPEKFVAVITDNAPVMKSAWEIIVARFPKITAHGCAAHALNLLIKDILDNVEDVEIMKDAEKIIKFVSNHHIVKALFEVKRKAFNVPHTLSMPVATRWFSRFNSMSSLLASKYALIQLVDDEGEMLKEIKPKTTSASVINLIKSQKFWDNVSDVVKKIEFPTKVIGKLEADDASLALVYNYFGELYQHFNGNSTIQDLVTERLDFLPSKSIGLAYILTPKYATNGFYFQNDQAYFISYAKEFAEIRNPEIADKVDTEMHAFVTKMSTLPRQLEETIFKMTSRSYWTTIGRREFPSLYIVAKPITEMICSSAAAERSWSTHRFIHSRLRNRLGNDKVRKLVFIYTNCVMLDKMDKNDYMFEGGAVMTGNDYDEENV